MSVYCIADEDTVRGFRLAGVAGEAVASPAEAAEAVRRMVASDAPGMLVLTDVVASEIRALVDQIRIERESPLIVEIPGPDGPMQGRKTLRQFVQEAVGIRVGDDEET